MADITIDQIPTTEANPQPEDILVGKRPGASTYQTTISDLSKAIGAGRVQVENAPYSNGSMILDAAEQQSVAFTATLGEDVTVEFSVSNVPASGSCKYYVFLTASGDRIFSASAFPAGVEFGGIWDDNISDGVTRYIEIIYNDGVPVVVRHNSPFAITAEEIVSGQINDARISESSVIQHTPIPDAPVPSPYTIQATDNINSPTAKGRTLILSGASPSVVLNTGLGAYDINAPAIYEIQNDGTGDLAITGTATLAAVGNATIPANGLGRIKQKTGTDQYRLSVFGGAGAETPPQVGTTPNIHYTLDQTTGLSVVNAGSDGATYNATLTKRVGIRTGATAGDEYAWLGGGEAWGANGVVGGLRVDNVTYNDGWTLLLDNTVDWSGRAGFTIAFWVNYDASNTGVVLFSAVNGGTIPLTLGRASSDAAIIRQNATSASSTGGPLFTAGNKLHTIWVFDPPNQACDVYINNDATPKTIALPDLDFDAPAVDDKTGFFFRQIQSGAFDSFAGSIADFRVYLDVKADATLRTEIFENA